MTKYKSKYKVKLYKMDNGNVIIESIKLEDVPKINDYVNIFAPKLSTYYSIQFYELQDSNCYKTLESWYRTKRGWKRVI